MPTSVTAGWWRDDGESTTVLPDGCVDLVWTQDGLVVAGPATRAVRVAAWPGGRRVGVRLRVGAVEAALGVPASALSDQEVALSALWDRRRHERAVRAMSSGPSGVRVLIGLLEQQADGVGPDELVRQALGRLRVEGAALPAAARGVGLSERQLRRRLDRSVGLGWQTLSRVQRLQSVLVAGARDRTATLAGLAAAAGYADQAHMSRDVRRLTGHTPSALLRSAARPAGETAGLFKTAPAGRSRLDA